MKNKSLRLIALLLLGFAFACEQSAPKNGSEPFPLEEISIMELHQFYLDKTLTVEEVVQQYLNRIEQIDKNGPTLNSIIQINPDALSIARQLDVELSEGKVRGYMHGIPVLLKDNIDTHDKMPTTGGSRALLGSFPDKDSWVAKKLRESGAVILGKTNLSEWANFRGELSSSGWSGVGGQTKNPYVLDRNPCGSSSGSGVAVSANLCMVAIGTETNGSIVCPSQANGIVGLKPTVGLVSRSGIIPISWTQDTPGPMTRSVSDAAICLEALVGIDSTDEKTLASADNYKTNYTSFLKNDGLKGKRIGLFTKALGTHFKVDALMNEAVELLKSEGVEIIEVSEIAKPEVEAYSFDVMLFEYKDGLNNYFKSLGINAPIATLEELIAFNKQDSIELKFYNQHYLEMANDKESLDSEQYKDALQQMHKGMREDGMDRVMNLNNLDAIIAPTGSPAWKTDWINGDFYMLGSSSPAAISGYPSITVPMGFVGELPVGISFFGRAWSEPLLLEIAYAYEQKTKHRKAPRFLTE